MDNWLDKYQDEEKYKFKTPTVVDDAIKNLDYSQFSPEHLNSTMHKYGFPSKVEDIQMSPNRIHTPQLSQEMYKTPEAIEADERLGKMSELHDQFSDFGTRALTLGTLLTQPTQAQLEAGRVGWKERAPMIANHAALALGFEVAPSVIGAGIKAPFQAYKGVMNAASKGELYKYNPFAGGIKENMAYRPITASRASKLIKGEPMLQYSKIPNTKSYMPVLNEAGDVTHYNIATNKDLFQKYSSNQPVTLNINKRSGAIKAQSTLSEVLDKVNSGKFAGNSMEIGKDKIITLPSKNDLARNIGKDYTESITNQLMSIRGGYPKVGTDVKFRWGKVPKNTEFTIPPKNKWNTPNTINRELLLEADPTKMSMVGAPTKGEFANYVPKDAGNFPLGKTLIPEEGIIGNELKYPSKGLRMLKLDPVKGYTPISETEAINLFETGAFKQDESKLINSILGIDKKLNVAKDFVTGTNKWVYSDIDKYRKLEKDALNMQQGVSNKIGQHEWKIRQKIGDITEHIPNPSGNSYYTDPKRYNEMTKSFKSSGKDLIGNEVGGLGKATNTGTQTITDFKTGKKVQANVKVPGTSTKYSVTKKKDELGFLKDYNALNKEVESTSDVVINDEYKQTLKNNIQHIEEKIPGAKVFGSSKGVSEGGLPHLTHDYDVLISQKNYEKSVKGKLDFVGDMRPAKQYTLDKKLGQEGVIDFNIIEENSLGNATGQRANEIFKQFHPDEYYKASRKAHEAGKQIEIPYTPEELLNKTDTSVKTVVDAYESIKPKHINKIDAYISYGNPEVVKQAQEKYLKSLVGSKGTVGHQFVPEQFADIDINKKLLTEIDFIGDVNSVAKNPEKMQIALNDFYINNTVLSRGVRDGDLKVVEKALKEYDPSAGGGDYMGAGQNNVFAGDSGYGPMYGNKQLGLKLNTSDPLKYVDDIKRQTDGNYLFTPEESVEVKQILDKFNIGHIDVPNTGQLIQSTRGHKQVKDVLSEVSKKTGKVVVSYGDYGNSKYVSTLKDFDEMLDVMEFSVKSDVTIPKPYKLRKENLLRNASQSITTPEEFHKIKSLLDGGIKRAEKRQELLNQYRVRYEKVINDKIKKATDKSAIIQEKKRVLDSLIEKELSANEKVRQLYRRSNRLDGIRTSIIAGGSIGGFTGGMSKLMKASNEKNDKSWFEYTTGKKYEFADDKMKSAFDEYMDYEDHYYDAVRAERKRARKSAEKVRKRVNHIPWNEFSRGKLTQKDNSDLLRTKKENGAWLSKYEDGGQLQKLNKLTTFTTGESNWLDKYNNEGENGDNNPKDGVDAISGAAPQKWQVPIKQREDFDGNFLSKTDRAINEAEKWSELGDYAVNLYKYYLGQPLSDNSGLNYSRYTPTKSKDKNVNYVAVNDEYFKKDIITQANRLFLDNNIWSDEESIKYNIHDAKINDRTYSIQGDGRFMPMGRFFISKGSDNKGEYISYYDKFDKGKGKSNNFRYIGDRKLGMNLIEDVGISKPYEIYDRIYVDKDESGKYIPKKENGGIVPLQKINKLTTFTRSTQWLDKYE